MSDVNTVKVRITLDLGSGPTVSALVSTGYTSAEWRAFTEDRQEWELRDDIRSLIDTNVVTTWEVEA